MEYNISQQYFSKNDIVSGNKYQTINSNNPEQELNSFEVYNVINKIFEDSGNMDNDEIKNNTNNMAELYSLYPSIITDLNNGSYITEKGSIETAADKKSPGNQVESFVEGSYGGSINGKELVIEGFKNGGNCCPQGSDLIDGVCQRVCVNCKYNNCDTQSHNIGQVYDYESNHKALESKKSNDIVLEYIFSGIDN